MSSGICGFGCTSARAPLFAYMLPWGEPFWSFDPAWALLFAEVFPAAVVCPSLGSGRGATGRGGGRRRRGCVRCYLRLLDYRILFDLGAHLRHHGSLVRDHESLMWSDPWQRFGLMNGGRSFPLDALCRSRSGLLNQLGIDGRRLQRPMGWAFP